MGMLCQNLLRFAGGPNSSLDAFAFGSTEKDITSFQYDVFNSESHAWFAGIAFVASWGTALILGPVLMWQYMKAEHHEYGTDAGPGSRRGLSFLHGLWEHHVEHQGNLPAPQTGALRLFSPRSAQGM